MARVRTSWVACFVPVVLCLVLAGLPQSAANAQDTTPPTGTIVINNNRSATNSRNVTLALTWDDGVGGSGVTRMRFSDDGATWSLWEPPAATRAYTLPAGPDGHRTVRVQFLDRANNRSVAYNDYIRLDTTPPTGTIIINSGASTTISQSVTLGLTWADGAGAGVARMRFSDDGAHWTAWEAPAASRAHTLPAGFGHHTVRVQYLDGANNYSAVYSDYINLVVPPAGTEETVMLPDSVPLVMVWIPAGTFTMGSPNTEQDRNADEGPQHTVTLGGFWMGKYELTKRQWQAVTGTTPWTGEAYVLADLDSPAVYVSWNDAQLFLAAVNAYTHRSFRLPSEAQWEYACRGETQSRFYWGNDPTYLSIDDYAWWDGNAWSAGEQYAHVVGQKLPNVWGLHDMSGNVFEWCEDDWHDDYSGAPADGQAWVDAPRGAHRVFRGGDWGDFGNGCRSAYRFTQIVPAFVSDGVGFRLSS